MAFGNGITIDQIENNKLSNTKLHKCYAQEFPVLLPEINVNQDEIGTKKYTQYTIKKTRNFIHCMISQVKAYIMSNDANNKNELR